MAKFFSADLHVGEKPAPGNPSYYRWGPPEAFQRHFLEICHQQIKNQHDELYLVGDLVTSSENLAFYDQLPDCALYIICGNKEKRIPNFTENALKFLPQHREKTKIATDAMQVEINSRVWRLIHRPEDALKYPTLLPTLCGHEHGFWRTKALPGGEPIINVGVDAWCGNLVNEQFIDLQYRGVTSGRFNRFMYQFNPDL